MKTYHDFLQDGGSRIGEQLDTLHSAINKRLARVRFMLAVASGKGGVGKSTVTILLANAFQSRGKKVGILDLDINGPSQTRLGGIENKMLVPGLNGLCPPETKNGIKILSFASLFPEDKAVDFTSVAKGESYTWRATKEFSIIADCLAHTDWGELDLLLLDLPPGAERTFQFAEFFGPRLSFILVTNPSALSKGVVQRCVNLLNKTPNKIIGVVENMHGYYCSDCDKVKPLFPWEQNPFTEIPLLGGIPFNPELAKYCDKGNLSQAFLGAEDQYVHMFQELAEKTWELL